MENDILKQAAADIRTKRQVIDANKHLYPIPSDVQNIRSHRVSPIIINQNQRKTNQNLKK